MPLANGYNYCYCSICVCSPGGRTIQQTRTKHNHEAADRRNAGRLKSDKGEMEEEAEDGEGGSIMTSGDVPQDVFEAGEYQGMDGDIDGDVYTGMRDDADEGSEEFDDHPSDYSMSQSDENERTAEDFDDPPLSDSDDEIPPATHTDDIRQDLIDDPWFMGLDSLPYNNEDEDDYEDPGEAHDLPPAFNEHPAIRNAYIRAFVMGSLKGSTHAAIQMHLEGVALAL